MAAEATALQTPPRRNNAVTSQLPASFSPAALSDDDTISDNCSDAGSDHFAFTPKRPGKIPRAWERKPATPFAPRTETQKIWKRVPLQDKSTNGAVEIRATAKEEANERGVKRVRLTTSQGGDSKENYANTQWDKRSDVAKRKVPKEQKNVLQSTRNSLSPLRRDSTFDLLNEPPPQTAIELETERVTMRLMEMQQEDARRQSVDTNAKSPSDTVETSRATSDLGSLQDLTNESNENCSPQISSSLKDEDEDESPEDEEVAASKDDTRVTPSKNEFFTDSVIFDDQDSESEVDEVFSPETMFGTSYMSKRGSDEASTDRNSEIERALEPSSLRQVVQQDGSEINQEGLNTFVQHKARACQLQIGSLEPTMVSEAETVMIPEIDLRPSSEWEDNATPMLQDSKAVQNPMNATKDISEQTSIDNKIADNTSGTTDSESHITNPGHDRDDTESQSSSETSLENLKVSLGRLTDLQIPQAEDILLQATEALQSDTDAFASSIPDLTSRLFTPQAPSITAPEPPPSDDTAYLHDFLTRARAQKAARVANSPEKISTMASSPAKNTRQALANLSTNPTSPIKFAQMELKPDEPLEGELDDEQATSPCRRSSRPRLPKPQKSIIPAIPNTIPVRRSNGTEFVFLQRTEAMQIALATRTNTKRNKGESVPPSARLETLGGGELSPIKDRKKSSKAKKTVKWNEKLTHEQFELALADQAEAAAEKIETETRPKVVEEKPISESEKTEKREKKKAKRLGTVNGTPAPKKVMPATALPVPTRTLRARTKA